MEARLDLFAYVRRAALPAICILLIGYFVSHAIIGPTGALAWRVYQAQHRVLDAQSAVIAEQKAAIGRRVKLLDPTGVDPDLADQLVRENLNVVKPDEVIITLNAY